jgi:short-subunit dehydrogenase
MTTQTAWVTGATGYWGQKLTLALIRHGYSVVAFSRRHPSEVLQAWADTQAGRTQPTDAPPFLRWAPLDWSAQEIELPETQYPKPSLLFHASGAVLPSLAEMLQVNVTAPTLWLRVLIQRWEQEKHPCCIGVLLGQNGRYGLPELRDFSTTQGALWTWSEATARDLKQRQSSVSLSMVFPPRAPSELQQQLASKLRKAPKLSKHPPSAEPLIEGVEKGWFRVGRSPWPLGLAFIKDYC